MLLQKCFERSQSMNQSFGVVQPVNTEHDLLVRRDQLGRFVCHLQETVVRDADGQGSNAHGSTSVLHQQAFTIDPAAEPPLTTFHEVQTVVFDVETDHVTTCKCRKIKTTLKLFEQWLDLWTWQLFRCDQKLIQFFPFSQRKLPVKV